MVTAERPGPIYPEGWCYAWLRRARQLDQFAKLGNVRMVVRRWEPGRSLGRAHWFEGGSSLIEIYAHEEHAENLGTIVHELAHLVAPNGHGGMWRRKYLAAASQLVGEELHAGGWWRSTSDCRKIDEVVVRAIMRWFGKRGTFDP